MADAAFLLTVGSFLLTVELFYLWLCLGAFYLQLDCWSCFAYNCSFFAYSGQLLLISTSMDCKKRTSPVSNQALTASKKLPPRKLKLIFSAHLALENRREF